jgi:hypothetical protein
MSYREWSCWPNAGPSSTTRHTPSSPLGDRHLAIPLDQELTFRKALLKLGYVLPDQRRP